MKIVVVGAGKLGYSIAEVLSEDKSSDIYLVEIDEDRCQAARDNLDILTVQGNGCSPLVVSRFKGADILIAVTNSDEQNMVCCSLAKRYGIKRTVARIRNEDYTSKEPKLVPDLFGVDLILNPEKITANDIFNIVNTSYALDIEDFADGKIRVFRTKLQETFPGSDRKVDDLIVEDLVRENILASGVLVALIIRDHKPIIPHGKTRLTSGDTVYFVGTKQAIEGFEKNFEKEDTRLKKVILIGAGSTGRFLAEQLDKNLKGIDLSVVDKDKERGQMLRERLDHASVHEFDATNMEKLVNVGVKEADCVICLTDDDKLNLLIALSAKHLGAKKTIVRVARNEYVGLMEKVGVDIVKSTRLLSASEVLRFVRQSGIGKMTLLEGGVVEALELEVQPNCKVEGKMLKNARLPEGCLVCSIVHGGEPVDAVGSTRLHEGDSVIVFTASKMAKDVMDMFRTDNSLKAKIAGAIGLR